MHTASFLRPIRNTKLSWENGARPYAMQWRSIIINVKAERERSLYGYVNKNQIVTYFAS